MSVLDRDALEQSPLADLHAIASELSIDGYRRLRKAQLVDAILDHQGPAPAGASPARAPRGSARAASEASADEAPAPRTEPEAPAEEDDRPAGRRRRPRRGGRGGRAGEERPGSREAAEAEDEESPSPASAGAAEREEDEVIEGVVELLPNGSGFVRVAPPDPSDADVYISAAQVKRCELVSGDTVSGPRRTPRRSERFASLVRVDSVNGRPVAELTSGARFDDLPAAFPFERFRLDSEDPTLKAIEFLAPIGKGSRVVIAGPPRAGKTEALRRLTQALTRHEDLQISLVLAGVRPEEIAEWRAAEPAPAGAVSFAASADAQGHAVELVIDQARRVAARGADAVVLLDTLDGLHPHAARKALAAARNIRDGGSLTVIATASRPLGGETTTIVLDSTLTGAGRFPAVDLAASGTLRAELLVGEPGAEAITRARSEALEAG